MQFHLVTATKPVDAAAARALVVVRLGQNPALRANYDLMLVSEFIDRVENLFGTAPKWEYGTESITLPDGKDAWIVAYNQGIGDDYGDWIANIEAYANQFPGLLSALGVRVDVSTGAYGATRTSLS